MSYQLAGMVECYQLDRESILPEFPTHVTSDEISRVDGVDDYGRYKIGCLRSPKYPENPAYMAGWYWAEDNQFGGFLEAA